MSGEFPHMLTFGTPLRIEEIKAQGDQYRVSGYASTFGTVDLGHDVVLPGAFDKTLADGHKIRFLANHRPDQVLGVPEMMKTDKKGLLGTWKITRTQLGEETYALLKDGALDSFSIGYIPTETDFSDNGEVRQLKSVDLLEVSVVSLPMNPDAVVTAVKAWADAMKAGGESGDETSPQIAALDLEQPLEELLSCEAQRTKDVLAHVQALYERRKEEFRAPTEAHKADVMRYRAEVEALWRAIDELSVAAEEAKAGRLQHGSIRLALELRRRRLQARGVLPRSEAA